MSKQNDQQEVIKAVVKMSRYTIYISLIAIASIIIVVVSFFGDFGSIPANVKNNSAAATPSAEANLSAKTATAAVPAIPADAWKAPDTAGIPAGKLGEQIRFGRELVAHTAQYFGPKGSIAQIANGMNCQNCHLDAGTRLFGNDYASFIADYPKKSGRSGRIEPASERLVECFERSMNGRSPDTSSKEIHAMLAYMKWLGKDVPKGAKLFGSATEKLPYLAVAADPAKGKMIFIQKCESCHGQNGQGLLAADKKTYQYPPLWGKDSYNDGAGMYRLSNFAGFVKNNMPYGATYQNPQLTNEEAWNVAAFVNSQPRPHRNQQADWKNLFKKPIDFPFGPYADQYSEKQHKFGPFKPIKEALAKLNTKQS